MKKMSKEFIYNRRHFLGNSIKTLGAVELTMMGCTNMHFTNQNSIDAMTNNHGTNIIAVKGVSAGVSLLNRSVAGYEPGSMITQSIPPVSRKIVT
jgi:hypothetical protein